MKLSGYNIIKQGSMTNEQLERELNVFNKSLYVYVDSLSEIQLHRFIKDFKLDTEDDYAIVESRGEYAILKTPTDKSTSRTANQL